VIVFRPTTQKSFTRRDLADVLTALSVVSTADGEYRNGYQSALLAVGLAMGMTVQHKDTSAVEIVEVTR